MTTRLTATSIGKLPAGEYTDPAVRGLQVRVREAYGKRVHSWLLRYKWQGRPVRIALGDQSLSLADARALALDARKLLDRGIDPRAAERPTRRRAPPKPAPTVATSPAAVPVKPVAGDRYSVPFLASEYLEKLVRKQRKRPEYVERFLEAEVLPADKWGKRDARTITPREVVELLDGIVERGSPTMANRGAGIVSQMFRYGIQRAIVEASPVQLLGKPGGKEKARERTLSEEETGFLLANLEAAMHYQTGAVGRSPRLAHVLRLLLLTGQRRGELALASWEHVTLAGQEPVWRIPAEHSKTGAQHTVPLAPAAVAEFETLKKYAGASAYVFPSADGKASGDPKLITRAVSRNLKRLKAAAAKCNPPVTLEDFTVHDLRRTCRTGLARLKVSHDVAERVLNHKLPRMREVYDQHEPLEEMRAALVKWADHLAELESGAKRAEQ